MGKAAKVATPTPTANCLLTPLHLQPSIHHLEQSTSTTSIYELSDCVHSASTKLPLDEAHKLNKRERVKEGKERGEDRLISPDSAVIFPPPAPRRVNHQLTNTPLNTTNITPSLTTTPPSRTHSLRLYPTTPLTPQQPQHTGTMAQPSRTFLQPQQHRISTTQTVTVSPTITGTQAPVLRLRAESRGERVEGREDVRVEGGREDQGRRIQWAEGTVDNEGLGRKKSKGTWRFS